MQHPMANASRAIVALLLVGLFGCDADSTGYPIDAADARSSVNGGAGGAAGSGGSAVGTGGMGATGGSSAGGTGAAGTSGSDAADARTDTLAGEAGGGDTGGCPPAGAAQAPAGVKPLRAISGFVTRNGSSLSLCGQPFEVLGTNVYYAQSQLCYGANNQQQVTDAFDDMVRMSLPVARIWAFYDGGNGDGATIRSAPGTYREEGLVGLDKAVAEAKKRGIRLIMTLTNYWEAYGGLTRYAMWANASGPQDFYSNTTMQGYFKEYATMLSKRVNTVTEIPYKDEPTILAWEIANELRCPKCASVDVVISTIDSLATFLKGIFPNHLISDGGEGFDDDESNWDTLSNTYAVRGEEKVSFSKIVKLASIDLASYHYYPADWGMKVDSTDTVTSDAKAWVEGHAKLAKAAGKVTFWGEFGFKKNVADAERGPIYDTWLASFFGPSGNGGIAAFWQLISTVRGVGGDEGYGVFVSRDTATVTALEKYSATRAPR